MAYQPCMNVSYKYYFRHWINKVVQGERDTKDHYSSDFGGSYKLLQLKLSKEKVSCQFKYYNQGNL